MPTPDVSILICAHNRLDMTRMVEEVPRTRKYAKRHITGVDQLLHLIDDVLTTAPEFSEGAMVTTPLTGILDWTMGTTAGMAAYRDPRVNAILKKRCVMAGLAPATFSAHGLRSGYLTEAARQGVPLQEAMAQSCHRSVQQAADYYNGAGIERGRAAQLG